MAEEPEGESCVLRIAVQGGGCSGFEYALGFDRARPGGRPRARGARRPGRRRPVQRSVPARGADRLPRRPPGVRVQDREPERRVGLRLRPFVPGRGRRSARGRRRLRLGLLALTQPARFWTRSARTCQSRAPCKVLRTIYRLWSSLIALAVLVQIGAAGYGAFYGASHLKDKGDIFTHKGFDHGWSFHIGLGWLTVYGILLALLLALIARVGRPRIWWAARPRGRGDPPDRLRPRRRGPPRRRRPAPAERAADRRRRGPDRRPGMAGRPGAGALRRHDCVARFPSPLGSEP